jgi:hypothetical protein
MSERENFLARWLRRKQAAAQQAEQASADGMSSAQRSTRATDAVGSLPPCGKRVKQETNAEVALAATTASPSSTAQGGEEETERAAHSGAHAPNCAPPVDLTRLPPIESITAETDISAFLAPGVPAELTRAALRRAWSVDPRIRDFIGPSESSWDFNAPNAMGGFGPLEMTDELRRQLLQMMGRGIVALNPAEPTDQIASQAPAGQSADQSTAMLAAPPSQEEQKTASLPQPLVEPTSDTDSYAQQENNDRARLVAKRSHGGALPK